MEATLPTYMKVMESIRQEIVSGSLGANQKIDSIKELSKKYNVNTNTMQRALVELEREGLLKSKRTAGKYVTENTLLIKSIRNKEARRVTEQFLSKLELLSINPEELVRLFTDPELAKAMGLT